MQSFDVAPVLRLDEQPPAECTDPDDHHRQRINLETALQLGALNHPSFERVEAPEGFLRAVRTQMRCGCMFLAVEA